MEPHADPAARVRAVLEATGAAVEVVRLDEPVPTAAVAAQRLGCAVAQIANSLVFEADGAPLLVLSSGAHRVDTARIAADLGHQRVRRASPEFVREHTGQEVGGVAPVGHPERLPTVLDVELGRVDRLWAGGGDEFTMIALDFETLVRITGGEVRPVR
jgi:prolyl-tRNA editing enzyme YbaK/EbsC (Cys-tRNA(Pro) deacylase)